MLDFFDNQLNKITMYKSVLYGLRGLVATAFILAFAGQLIFTPLQLAVSVSILVAVCYVVNKAFSYFLEAPINTESSIITALILFFVFPAPRDINEGLLLALAGFIAIASKFLLAIHRKHIFNPVVVPALLLSITGLFPAIWWVGTGALLPFTLIVGLLIVRKIRKFKMFLSFVLAALVVAIAVGFTNDRGVAQVLVTAFVSFPLIFLGTIMLTEPATLPPRSRQQIIYGLVVGAIFTAQLSLGIVTTSPEVALAIGNLYSYLISPRRRYIMTLKQKVKMSENIYDYIFTPNSPVRFEAGQYLEWTLPHKSPDMRGNRRTFTVASSPSESDVHLGVKFYTPSSTYKMALKNMEVGDSLVAGQLAGDFTLPNDPSQKLLFVAGGIGVTPFRSMLKQLIDSDRRSDAVLIYAVARQSDVVYLDVLKEAEKFGIKTMKIVGEPVTEAVIKAAAPDAAERQIYISGPPPMVQGCKKTLSAMGIKRQQIIVDYFTGY